MTEKVIIGNAELWHGDCREVLPGLPKTAAIVSDPPYGISYQHSGGGKGKHAGAKFGQHHNFGGQAIIGDDAPFDPEHLCDWPCVLFGADHYAARLPCDGVFHVWDKDPRGQMEWDSFSDAELVWTNWRTRRRVFRFLWKGLCQQGGIPVKRMHPTMKPVEVMMWCIQMLKKGTSVICDPYMGSGSTGIAAMNLGLNFIGVELDRKYFDTACERIETAQRQAKLLPPDEKVGAGNTAIQEEML